MATVTDAVHMIEAAKNAKLTQQEMGLVEAFIVESAVANVVPVISTDGAMSYEFTREDALPQDAYRSLNEDVTASHGTTERVTETLKVLTQRFKVDSAYGDAQRAEITRKQLALHLKGIAATVNLKFFKGTDVTVGELKGLQQRASGNQLIAAGSSSGGDALSLAKMDELVRAVSGPNKVLWMGLEMADLFDAASRSTSFNNYVWQVPAGEVGLNFAGRVTTFKGIPIIRVSGLDGTDNVLDFTEANPGGGSAVGTSIYCTALGENGVHLLQNRPVSTTAIGMGSTQPNFVHQIEWVHGVAIKRIKALGRLYGIKTSAIVA